MKKIDNDEIIEGQRIGQFNIGDHYSKVKEECGDDCVVTELKNCKTITLGNGKLWFDLNGYLYQIGVFGNFCGKFRGVIGIQSTLTDVKKHIGEYQREFDTYILANCDGICFELEDIDDWDEEKAPIEYIFVFKIS